MSVIKVYPKNPYSSAKSNLTSQDLAGILGMSKSGLNLYKFLLENEHVFVSFDGLVYINPSEVMTYLDCTRKSIYNGVEELLIKNVIHRTGKPGQYYFNPKFFRK